MSESFAELLEESLNNSEMKPGAVIEAEVVDINGDYVIVNAGLKSESEIPASQFRDSEGAVQVNILDRVVVRIAYHSSGAFGLIVTAGVYLRFTEALLFAQGAQVHGGGAVGRLAPEHLESLVEDGKVLLTVHQDAASRLEELPSFADGHMVGGANQVQHVAGTDLQSHPAQHLSEQRQAM